MKRLFLDESGDHSLTKIDPSYPMFVLGGVIVNVEYADQVMQPALDQFKLDLFGSKNLVLHTSDITRNRNGFERLKDTAFREEFHARLNGLMRGLEYKVVACAIRKDEHLARYGAAALDPYMLSLDILVERFCIEIGNVPGGGEMLVEARGHPLDAQLELAWENLKVQGTYYLRAAEVRRRISGLAVRDKQENIAGLQLADLVVSPIGRFVLGKRSHEDWQIIESKFRRLGSGYVGPGLVVLPKGK